MKRFFKGMMKQMVLLVFSAALSFSVCNAAEIYEEVFSWGESGGNHIYGNDAIASVGWKIPKSLNHYASAYFTPKEVAANGYEITEVQKNYI